MGCGLPSTHTVTLRLVARWPSTLAATSPSRTLCSATQHSLASTSDRKPGGKRSACRSASFAPTCLARRIRLQRGYVSETPILRIADQATRHAACLPCLACARSSRFVRPWPPCSRPGTLGQMRCAWTTIGERAAITTRSSCEHSPHISHTYSIHMQTHALICTIIFSSDTHVTPLYCSFLDPLTL